MDVNNIETEIGSTIFSYEESFKASTSAKVICKPEIEYTPWVGGSGAFSYPNTSIPCISRATPPYFFANHKSLELYNITQANDTKNSTEINNCNTNKTLRNRNNLTPLQKSTFHKLYDECRYPSNEEKEKVSKETDIPFRKVTVWFQNQRALEKKRVAISNKPSNNNIVKSSNEMNI